MPNSSKQIIMYIASPAQASEFKNRCTTISDEVEIATLGGFGKENPHDSFLKMSKLMLKGSVNWTIFHWKDVSQLIGGQVLIKELKELIKTGACKRSKTFIVDPDGDVMDKSVFSAYGIGVVKDESEIGMPFAKMLNAQELELQKAGNENDVFGGINAPAKDYSGDGNRLPGMSATTPGSVQRNEVDPFDEIAGMNSGDGANDPFSAYDRNAGSNGGANAANDDPFAAFNPGKSAAQSADDIFAELADDLGAEDISDDLGNGLGEDVFDDGLFEMLEAQADEAIANAEDPNDPFAAFQFMDDNSILGGADAFADGDPFAAMMNDLQQKEAAAANVDVSDVIGGIGGVMDGTSVADDVVGFDGVQGSGAGGANGSAGGDDFFDDSIFDGSTAMESLDDEGFDPFAKADIDSADEDDEFDDPFGAMTDEDRQMAHDAVAAAENGGGIVLAGQGGGDPFAGRDNLTLDDIFEYYGERIGITDYNKLVSMLEPDWDYTLEEMDGIGIGGNSGAKGMFGGGKKKAKSTYSQVEEYTLADSVYIPEMEQQNGIYSPPEECKLIISSSLKGGSGKTSVAVGISTQLNWYFNKALMQKFTTSYQSRVLILSINEFDDIPVHGVGYDGFNPDQDEDGRNIAELLRRIDETAGNTTWDDIMHCFVATDQNRVFYLPSLTQREMLEDNINITAEDYKRVFECCAKFFQFIIVDTPDIFYQEKNDLMNFIYSAADIIAMIIEPDSRSVTNLYHFFNGLEVETGRVPLNPAKCLLVVNKYVTKGNPYIVQPIDQLKFEDISKGTSKYFSRFASIPFTHPRGTSNVLYGTDPKVKEAYADLADTILEMIAQNDLVEQQKKGKKKK